jgi:hypothetical protein
MTKPKHRRAHWSDAVKSPKAIAQTGKRNPQLLAFTGAVGAAGAAEAGKDKLPEKYQDEADTVAHAVYGGAAGQAAYQLSGYGAKHANKKINDPKIYKNPKTRRGGYTKPEYKKAIEGNKSKYGIKDPRKKSDWKGFQRNYPKDVPGGRVVRVLSRTHAGKSGMLVGGAATAAGAALAVKAGKKKDEKVSKHAADPFGIYEISKIKATTKLMAGAKRGFFDAAGVTHPKLREKAYAGNDPVKSKLYRMARTKTRKEMEPRLIALREHPAVKRAAFRIVREEAGKKVQAAKPYAAGAVLGGGAAGGVAYANQDEAERAARKTTKKVQSTLTKRDNLTQEQIDRRKKVQAVTSRTTGALGLGALGAQGVGLAVSRGKLKKLPTLKGGKPGLREVKDPAADSKKIKDATVPMLATSAGIGSIGAFNFASYTKAEAKQRKH